MLIACAVLTRECELCIANSKNAIDIKLIKQGLHDIGEEKMSASLQEELDAVDQTKYDAILLAYGLCNNGVRNIHANIPIIIPRAHDCITLLMGSTSKYNDYFNSHPGTFFLSPGWVEEAGDNLDNPESTTRQLGMSSYEEYVEKYGEENAKYLAETLNDHLKNYTHIAYIDTSTPGSDIPEKEAEQWAKEKGWDYSKVQGDTRLISKLTEGDWDEEEFLTVQPGQTIEPSYDERIVKAEGRGQ
jgi:hypothetical protein